MKVKAILLTVLMTASLGLEARVLEGANAHSTTVVVESSWGSTFKKWAKAKVKEVNAEIKKEYGVDVLHKVRMKVDDAYIARYEKQQKIAEAKRIAAEKEAAKKAEEAKRVADLKSALPTYKAEETQKSLEAVNNLKNQLGAAVLLNVVDAGRKADPSLKKKKSGVPYFSLYKKKTVKNKKGKKRYVNIKVKNLPKLNVGLEPKINKSDFDVDGINILTPRYELAKSLPAVSTVSREALSPWLKKKMQKLKGPMGLKFKDYGLSKVVTQEMIDKINPVAKTEVTTPLKTFDKLKKVELKMLSALLLYNEGGNCHAVAGIFDDLSNEPGFKDEANFHLGICAHEMGFYSESTKRLNQVIQQEDNYYAPKAIEVLTKNLPREYEINFARAIKSIKNKKIIPEKVVDDVHFILARAASKERKFKEASQWATLVSQKSNHYPKALFIKGIAQYAEGKMDNAIDTLVSARKWMDENNITNKNLSSLIAVDLGRMFFKKKNFKRSHEEYLNIHKDHPLWVTGLIEQGWAQLMLGDSSGAIGNMYSLHSPYFGAVFMPESYAVRTIGYLNICQYGDAYQTLKMMEGKYLPWKSQVARYLSKNKTDKPYYSTLEKYLSQKSNTNVDGLPYQVIREMARRRNFINLQDSLNEKADELDQFRYIASYIKQDTSKTKRRINLAKSRMAKYKKEIKLLKKKDGFAAKITALRSAYKRENVTRWQKEFKLSVLDYSKKGFYKMRNRVTKRLRGERYWLKNQASKALHANLRKMNREMRMIVSNNEFLRYEVFAGSGENIRYLAAGGKTTGANRLPASIKPTKALSWSVTGEYWEDELGNYRSALKNNCPERNNYQLPKLVGKKSARK